LPQRGEPHGGLGEPRGWRGAATDSVKSPTAGGKRRYTDGPEQVWSVAKKSAGSVVAGSSTMNGGMGAGTERQQHTRPCVACSRT